MNHTASILFFKISIILETKLASIEASILSPNKKDFQFLGVLKTAIFKT
jgi:hypothetical protein